MPTERSNINTLMHNMAIADIKSGAIQLKGNSDPQCRDARDRSDGWVLIPIPANVQLRYATMQALYDLGLEAADILVNGQEAGKGDYLHTMIKDMCDSPAYKGDLVLTLRNSGVEKLVQAGVTHPLLDEVAQYLGIEPAVSSHAARVGK